MKTPKVSCTERRLREGRVGKKEKKGLRGFAQVPRKTTWEAGRDLIHRYPPQSADSSLFWLPGLPACSPEGQEMIFSALSSWIPAIPT